MTRHAVKSAFVWLCLLLQFIASTSSAAGLVLCVEDDGSVALETHLTQLSCCGELANPDKRSHSEFEQVGEDACIDAPFDLPVSLRAASSRDGDDAYLTGWAATTIAAPLLSTHPAALQLHPPPQVVLPDRTLKARSTVVLLV
jgi:hypothetical protein